jgi:ankyrin repeat protein
MDIHQYCRDGNLEALRLLISNGVNVNVKDNFEACPLHYACLYGHLGIVRELIKHNAIINETDNSGSTPLYYATKYGYLEIVQEIISYTDLSIQNEFGMTVLDVVTTEDIKQCINDYLNFSEIKEPEDYSTGSFIKGNPS